MSQIDLINIAKSYDKQKDVLNGIDLSIEEGEFFVLVGPSGSGKSTLLRMIAGLEEISGGVLKINGQTVNHLPPKDRNLSMVFQNYALYPHLSVKENILFGLKGRKVEKQEQMRRLHDAVEMLGLQDLLKRKPRELSGGQRQRVALGRAVVSHAPLCLMDEPLSNLDAKLRANMRVEIRRLQKKLGLTMVYVTHDQVEAMTMGDRIMVLNDGKIQQIGKPITLYNEPENLFVASFIGSPKINLGNAVFSENAKHLIIEDELHIPVDPAVFHHIPKDRKLTVGIRAEHLEPCLAKKENMYKLEAVNVEQLGNETLIAFEVGSELWTAKWPGQWQIEFGQKVLVQMKPENLLFFDADSGELIKSAELETSQGAVTV
ncbi:ABC transporter ATP-binding protein [Mesobacillus stamsii]|uniref:Sn-glycerol 3-phosphate transport system ATP-binding protein n=1 Tax=Mesobacillus stamsii TaxID=225347 RepID=A0ABU0FRC9_9BACI|nr:ABC transporter ATP-binding protein [Mesobacillus stamsii]MDQ0412300.1 sn-glycerol 3-phosphate transport system ATP-binding protein [Mesobacillus stamsii]